MNEEEINIKKVLIDDRATGKLYAKETVIEEKYANKGYLDEEWKGYIESLEQSDYFN